ncbi:MAG TPA: MarR family transcriptional regulator [Candidatus Cottocaccamicrobium excrementipullorum]|nr:MarR family transcriptional regulator [Candidatus Cottocaccamicrobium excrementipullorum]
MFDKHTLMLLIIRAEKARKNVMQPLLSDIGLTFGQGHVRILNALAAKDHVSQKELANRCHMDVTTISRSLDKLEQSGYLVRQRDPDSRRSFLICLTEAGQEEAKKVKQILAQVDDQMCTGFSVEEMTIFAQYLERFCENLENSSFIDEKAKID